MAICTSHARPALKTRLLMGLALSVFLAGCTDAPDAQSPHINLPQLWKSMGQSKADSVDATLQTSLQSAANAPIEHRWWQHFGDQTLDHLMTQSITNNKTLAIAKTRVEEARANRGISNSKLLPEITGTGNATRGNSGALSNDKVTGQLQAGAQASWELDLFGRNQAKVAQSQALLESEEAGSQAVMVGLLAEVARNYFDLRNFEQQITITKQNLTIQQKTLAITKAQKQGALASDFDVQRAAAQVATTQSQLPQLRSQYEAALNRLNVLIGAAPGTLDAGMQSKQDFKALDPAILVAAPATVIAARPDVRAAERRFAASISARTAAARDLFPTLSLSAFYGVQDSTLLSTNPWSIGASLVQPVLNWGRIESQIDAADARQKQAFLSYQQTVLEALEDMENALSRYLNEAQRNQSLAQAVAHNQKAVSLAEQQYSAGYSGLLDLLVSQQNVLDAESTRAASDAALRKYLVAIYAAAGGGWDLNAQGAPAPVAAPAAPIAAPMSSAPATTPPAPKEAPTPAEPVPLSIQKGALKAAPEAKPLLQQKPQQSSPDDLVIEEAKPEKVAPSIPAPATVETPKNAAPVSQEKPKEKPEAAPADSGAGFLPKLDEFLPKIRLGDPQQNLHPDPHALRLDDTPIDTDAKAKPASDSTGKGEKMLQAPDLPESLPDLPDSDPGRL